MIELCPPRSWGRQPGVWWVVSCFVVALCFIMAAGATGAVAVPTCNVSGANSICPAITNTYTASTDATNGTFTWSIMANTAGAVIVGSNGGPGVQVRSERGGTFLLNVTINDGTHQAFCSKAVNVLTNANATPLANATACPGGTAIFSTTASGTGPFAYVWRKDGNALPEQTGSQLRLTNLTIADGGVYCVEVGGPCNTVTNCAILTIYLATRATALSNLSRCVGEGAVFSTIGTGTGPFTYRWRKDGNELPGQTNRILSIPAVSMADGGTYAVEVTGSCNSVTNSGQLRIYALPACGIQGSATICPESTGNLFMAPPGMAEYRWRVLGNGVVVGATNQQAATVAAASAGFLTINLTTVNSNGCSRSCSRTITVGDIQPPVVICPENVQTNTELGECSRVIEFAISASDNCEGVAATCNPPSGSRFARGTTTVTCAAVDASGNQAGCSFNVTVVDLERPVLTWPTNLVVSTRPGVCEATVTYAVTAADNCPDTSVICSPPSGTVFPLGTSIVNCRGSDASGNVEFCAFEVKVVDNEGPQIVCAPDLAFATDAGECDVLVEYQVDASDNCAMADVLCIPPSGSLFRVGATTVMCVARDVNENQSRCSFLVQVDDGENPRIVCPGNMKAPCEPGRCDAVVNFAVMASDNCGEVSVICEPPAGTRFGVGQTNVTCTATDSSGNTATCAFTVEVFDNERPVLACSTNMVVNTASGACDAIVAYTTTVTDNCGGVEVFCDWPSGATFPLGETWVYCVAVDDAGNVQDCGFTITVNDLEPPQFVCPGDIQTVTDAGRCDALVNFTVDLFDNCGGAAVLCVPPSGSQFARGTTLVSCTATDASGNEAACSFTVRVNDNQPPGLECPANIVTNAANGRCDAVVNYAAIATDNCAVAAVVCVPPSGAAFGPGTTLVNCLAADESGNSNRCSFSVTVEDDEKPIIVCPQSIELPTDPGRCDAEATFAPSASDNCPGVTVVCTPPSGAKFVSGVTIVNCTASDSSSNRASCSFAVTVRDQENPVISCPSEIVTNTAPQRCDQIVEFSAPVTDNCAANVICEPAGGSTFPVGTNVVTCTATDAASNTQACAFSVVVVDLETPSVNCPIDITAQTEPGRCDAAVMFDAAATDNCLVGSVSCAPPSGSRFSKGTNTVNCTAADVSGNTEVCSFQVIVTDRELPTLVCPQDVVANADVGSCFASVTFSSSVGDNCDGASVRCTPASGSRFTIGLTTVVCEGTDASGNTRSCAFNVRVLDAEPPRLTCPDGLAVNTAPGECVAAVDYVPAAADNCSLTEVACVPPSGSLFNKGVTLVHCTAKDGSDNDTVCAFNVTVRDAETPLIVCSTNIVASAVAGGCDAPVGYEVSVLDNCDDVGLFCTPPSGSTFALGTTLVTCRAWDAAGNTNECTFTVRVTDTEKPTLTCPTNMIVNCESNRCDAIVTFAILAEDGCAAVDVSCTPPSGSRFNLGETPVACSGSDAAGNVGTCSFSVAVIDGEAPVLQCPGNIFGTALAGRCDAPVTFNVTAADNCGTVGVSCFPPSGSNFPVGTSTVNCSAFDGNLNVGACQFSVTIRDIQSPALQCPADITANTAIGRCDAVVSFTPQVSDNCSSVGVSCTPPSGSTFQKGTNYVTCTARDASSNSINCTFRVIVRDTENPQIACPGDIVVSADKDQCGAKVTFSSTASDNCGGVGILCNPPSNSRFNRGVTTVNCVATDTSGNTNRCSFTVTVNDTTPPNITCPENIITNAAPGVRSAVVQFAPLVLDNCPATSQTCTPASGATFQEGTTPVTCTAMDGSGNTRSCSFTVSVNDTEAPLISCPTNVIVATSPGRCDAVCGYTVTATDNSGMVALVCTPPSGSLLPKGSTNVLCTATDPANNRSTCSFTLTVADLELPVITCPTNRILYTDPGRCDARLSYTTNATDNCGITSFICNPPSGALLPKGTNTVTCTATDSSGNVQACAFTVRVADNERPAITCPAKMVFNTPPGQCAASVTYNVSATDNCPGTSVSCTPVSGSQFQKGSTTVNCTARDSSGNTANCSFQVELRDVEPPAITCPSDINTINYPGSCGIPVTYMASVTDNCPGATILCTPPSGATMPVGTNIVTCTATDASGNTAGCSFRITVRDVESPVITCPGDVMVDGSNGLCTPVVTYNPAVTDNCPGAAVTCIPPSGTSFPHGTTRVQCSGRDGSGNMSACSFSVTVRLEPLTATPLQSQTGCAGESITFATTATGSGPIAFSWFKDGALLQGRTNSSLTLTNLAVADSGLYSVRVQSPCAAITNSAALTVRSQVIVSGVTNVTRCDCDALVLSPMVSGTGPFTYVWRKDGAIISGATSNTLAFAKLSTNEAGVYTIEVSGACNTATASASLSVIKVPNPAVYTNGGGITISDNAPAFPYPSSVHVTCVPQTVKRVTLTLRGFTHGYPDDVDALLAAPDGRTVLLMSDVGAGSLANNINIMLDDSASAPLPDSDQLFTGAFRPANYDSDADNFPSPAPKTPVGDRLSALAGAEPNGFWSLFVTDDFQLDSGMINNGWVLRLYWESSPMRMGAPKLLPDGAFQMLISGDAQSTCTIEASTDLHTWSPIATLTLTGPETPFTDPNPPSPRFYRAVQQ